MRPLISIVIPLFNREHLICYTLKSILLQSYTNWECIIVDDRSIDNAYSVTQSFIKDDARFKLLKNTTDSKGPSICRKIGMDQCQGDFVVFLDSDDLLAPWCLEKRVENISSKDIDVLLSNGIQYDFSNTQIGCYTTRFGVQNVLDEFLNFKVVFQTTAPTWKLAFLKKHDIQWDRNLVQWDDVDFAISAFKFNPKFQWGRELPDYFMRREDNHSSLSDSTDILSKYLTNFQTFEKWRFVVSKNSKKFEEDFIRYMLDKIEFNLNKKQILQFIRYNNRLLKNYLGSRAVFYLKLHALTKEVKFLNGLIYRSRFLCTGVSRQIDDRVITTIKYNFDDLLDQEFELYGFKSFIYFQKNTLDCLVNEKCI